MHIQTQNTTKENEFNVNVGNLAKFFGLSLYLTGIFAFVGSIYTWGSGF